MRTSTDARRDAGVSETLGTILTIGLVVTLVAGVAIVGRGMTAPPEGPPVADLVSEGRVGDDSILVTHVSGGPLDPAQVRLVVTAGAETLFDGQPGSSDEWRAGETRRLDLLQPIPDGVDVQSTLTFLGGHATIAGGPVALDRTPPAPGTARLGIAVDLANGSADRVAVGTDALRVEATVAHHDGRKLIDTVTASLEDVSTAPIALVDDGTHGDTTPHDGVYAGYLSLPLGIAPGEYRLLIEVTDLHGETGGAVGLVIVEGATGAIPDPAPILPALPTPAPTPTPPPPTRDPPPFEILPPGGVRPRCDGPMTLRVIGVDITYGPTGPRIPVRAEGTLNGGATMLPLFGGGPVSRGMTQTFEVTTRDVIGVRGYADYESFHSTYASWVADPHVRVLKDGDRAPDVPAFGPLQQDLEVYLAPYVTDGRIRLATDEVIVLFEFVRDLSSSAADFQDLVVLYDFDCREPPPRVTAFPGSANPACTDLPGGSGWSEAKLEPIRPGAFPLAGVTVTISNYDGRSFDWSSDRPIDAVYVKGGSGGSNLYDHTPPTTRGTGVRTPGETGNHINHVSFCYTA